MTSNVIFTEPEATRHHTPRVRPLRYPYVSANNHRTNLISRQHCMLRRIFKLRTHISGVNMSNGVNEPPAEPKAAAKKQRRGLLPPEVVEVVIPSLKVGAFSGTILFQGVGREQDDADLRQAASVSSPESPPASSKTPRRLFSASQPGSNGSLWDQATGVGRPLRRSAHFYWIALTQCSHENGC